MPYLTEDDFEPEIMYLKNYPRLVYWKSLEPVEKGELSFLATIIARKNTPDDYEYFVPSLQVSGFRAGGTVSNQLAEELESTYEMQEAIDNINLAIDEIAQEYADGTYQLPFIDDFDPNADTNDWSKITTPFDYME